MSLKKHNRWSRIIPLGTTKTDLKNRLRLTTLTERERSVCRLVLDTADPTNADPRKEFTLTVAFICESIGFSPENVWPKVRNLLTEKGMLASCSEPLGRGEKRWHLNFDFTPLAAGVFDKPVELFTDTTKNKGSRARVRDPLRLGGSRDPLEKAGSRDPVRKRGLEPETLEPEKPTAKAAAVASGLTEIERRLPGVAQPELERVIAALAGATEDQTTAFFQIFSDRRAGARDAVALCIGLARLASRGELRVTNDGQTAPQIELAEDVCMNHDGWIGHIEDPSGVLAVAQAGNFGLLHGRSGGVFAQAESARFWRKVDAGELDFVESTAKRKVTEVTSSS